VSGTNIGWDDWVAYKAAHPPPTSASVPQGDAEELTLTAITELIRSGRTDLLPNNRKVDERLSVRRPLSHSKGDVEQTIQEDKPSESVAIPRRKPWEKEETS